VRPGFATWDPLHATTQVVIVLVGSLFWFLPLTAASSPRALPAVAVPTVTGASVGSPDWLLVNGRVSRNAPIGRDQTKSSSDPSPTSTATTKDGFVSPVPGPITGGFGMRFHPIMHINRMHNGADMRADCGTPVVAAYPGRVTYVGWNGGYGRLVVIDHGTVRGSHVETKYAHLSVIGVRAGQKVSQAQGIALSGTTGLSTGCHLHFEVKQNGVYVDPGPWLSGKPSPRPTQRIQDLNPNLPSTAPSPSVSSSPSSSPSTSPHVSATSTRPSTSSPTTSVSPTVSHSTSASPSPSPTTSASPSPSPTKSDSPDPTPSDTPTTRPDPSPQPEPEPDPPTQEPSSEPSSASTSASEPSPEG
jgi:hypothetical protein